MHYKTHLHPIFGKRHFVKVFIPQIHSENLLMYLFQNQYASISNCIESFILIKIFWLLYSRSNGLDQFIRQGIFTKKRYLMNVTVCDKVKFLTSLIPPDAMTRDLL